MIVPTPSAPSGPGPSPGRRRRVLIAVEACLWIAGLSCAGILLTGEFSARASARSAQAIGAQKPDSTASPAPAAGDAVVGRLEIGKIGLKVPVLADYDPASLKRGVGHIPGTAQPGGLGNLGLAGHRDTFFRPLRNIRLGMEVDVITGQGKFRYSVDSTEIVTPDQVSVLDIHNRPELTLITCYPFEFIGAAPKRFIVHAHLLSLDPG